jgi:hypothetical protein
MKNVESFQVECRMSTNVLFLKNTFCVLFDVKNVMKESMTNYLALNSISFQKN